MFANRWNAGLGFMRRLWHRNEPVREQFMHENSFVPVASDVRAGQDIRERGFTRRPLHVDLDVARALGELAHAAWSLPKDQYYQGGGSVSARSIDSRRRYWRAE